MTPTRARHVAALVALMHAAAFAQQLDPAVEMYGLNGGYFHGNLQGSGLLQLRDPSTVSLARETESV